MRVLIFGTFDHVHPGHLFVFERATERGDVTVVIARDSSVEAIKGKAPDHTEQERQQAVQQALPEAEVILGDPDDYLEPVRTVQPDLILLGYDQQLPPGVLESDLPCSVERLEPFEPQKYKSSLMR